jgi:glycine cleavage system regulatory protein
MCRLGGEFAGILRIELPVEKRQMLLDALQALQGRGLTAVVRPGETTASTTQGRQARLEIVGHDHPGIVREITSALARANVNVEEFSSECVSAPMSGETLFKAVARLQLPGGCDDAALKTDLEKIADDLLVDVSFAELGNQ